MRWQHDSTQGNIMHLPLIMYILYEIPWHAKVCEVATKVAVQALHHFMHNSDMQHAHMQHIRRIVNQ